MKKFLTVLLALSVVFTYTVGTAFAGEVTYGEKLAQAENAVLSELANTYADVPALLEDGKIADIDVDKEAYLATAEDVYNDYVKVIRDATGVLAADEANHKNDDVLTLKTAYDDILGTSEGLTAKKYADVKGVNNFIAVVKSTSTVAANGNAYLANALRHQFGLTKADVKTEINKIDLSKYSDNIANEDDPFEKTWNQLATEKQQEILAEIENIVVAADANADTAADKIRALNAIVPKYLTAIYDEDDATVVVDYEIKGLLTKDDEGIAGETLETKKLAAKSAVNKAAADFYADALDAKLSKSELAKMAKLRDAYLETQLYLVEVAEADTDLAKVETVLNYSATAATVYKYVDYVDTYKALENFANVAKMTTDKTGALVYDAAKVDKNLATVKAEVYNYGPTIAVTDKQVSVWENKILDKAELIAEDLDWEKNVTIAALEDERDSLLYNANDEDKYYALEKAEIEKLYDAQIAKVNAATTVKQVEILAKQDVVPATLEAKIKSDIERTIKNLTKFDGEYKKALAYITYLNKGFEGKDEYRNPANLMDKMAVLYAEKDARTNDEIVALFDEVKAMIEALPTNGQIKADKNAVDEMIKALPATITLADKDAIKAAYEAKEALPEGTVLVYGSKLTDAIAKVQLLEKKAIDAMFKDLPKVSEITPADKDSVKAVEAAVKAFNDEAMYTSDYTANAIAPYLTAVRNADLASLIATINAIPENPTAADKAAIEAARAAYDAYVAEYTDYLTQDDARNDVINDGRLFTAEANLKANMIKAVEALKVVKNHSVAGKGYIKIAWSVKGDAVAADGYQIYRATKANGKYTKFFTTSKMTYKNTKSLKKGTKYYYKVRAYKTVDGVKYYSDWSNKAYRVAK